jgi:hypothetical protein
LEGFPNKSILFKNHFFLTGQFIVDPFYDDIQCFWLMDEIQVIGLDRQNRTEVKIAQPVIVV